MRLQLIWERKTLGPDILRNIQLYEHSWRPPYWLVSAKTWPHPTPVGSGASHSMAALQACKVWLPPACLAWVRRVLPRRFLRLSHMSSGPLAWGEKGLPEALFIFACCRLCMAWSGICKQQ